MKTCCVPRFQILGLITLACFVLTGVVVAQESAIATPEVSSDVHHDVSLPLRDMSPNPFAMVRQHVVPLGRPTPAETKSPQPDPVLQTSIGPLVSTSAGLNFIGVGVG